MAWQTTMGCTSEFTTLLKTTKVIVVRDGSTRIVPTTSLGGGLGAYGVQVRYANTDFVSATVTPTSPTSFTSSTSATTSDSRNVPTSTGGSGLSKGAITGIGIGAAVVVLLAAIGSFCALEKT